MAITEKSVPSPAGKPKPLDLHQETFQDLLREWARGAPWLLVSVGFHLVVCLVLANINWQTLRTDEPRIITCATPTEELAKELDFKPLINKETIDPPKVPLEYPFVDPDIEIVDTPEVTDETPITKTPDSSKFPSIIGTGIGGGFKPGGKFGKRQGHIGATATQQNVDWGLAWLANHQDPEGFWDCDGFEMQCTDRRCCGRGQPLNDVGVTGLALLAFLGAGESPTHGVYKNTVRKGLRYLCDIQDAETGCLPTRENPHYMYNHALGCLALTEAYGLSHWLKVKKPAEKALEFIHTSKNPGKAWRYNRGDETDPLEENDVSVTGWMVMCLASAKDFGLPYHRDDMKDALMYIDEMTDSATGRTGYKMRGSYSSREGGDESLWPYDQVECMTAVGMLSRVFANSLLGDEGGDPQQMEMLRKGARLLRDKLPRWDESAGTIDYYYWYYGSYAMFQMAGADWKIWKKPMIEALVENQCMEGCEKGSWDPGVDPWGDNGGRIYSTALCTLCLEVFYRYDNVMIGRF